jgi:predicted membrane protein
LNLVFALGDPLGFLLDLPSSALVAARLYTFVNIRNHTYNTYVRHIVAAVLFFARAAAAVLLALLVLEGSVILSELFAVLEHKAKRTPLTRARARARV